MQLELRRVDFSTRGIEIDVTCRNLTATTLTVPAPGLACEVEAVSQGSDRATSAKLLLLNEQLDHGQPSGAVASTGRQVGSGEALGGSIVLPLAPGEYSVRAHLASDTAIVAVPIIVSVPKR